MVRSVTWIDKFSQIGCTSQLPHLTSSTIMSERRAEITSKISDLLVKTGEKQRLLEFIENRLIETGWNEKVKQACKDYIKTKGVDNISVEMVVQAISPSAKQIIPPGVRQDVLDQLRRFLVQYDIEV
ncbi:hypothetical protein CRM22_010271 [Opisthorchis felineus]|uniref:Transcription and mRNA export factor ENY2 n=1 Tax=Opisthorchis felineus TaxID=147828 RepID=A0A4S2L027_OPIFE|nr:hypothetical protein CRM22_010271 [Opisthorchis felineus]